MELGPYLNTLLCEIEELVSDIFSATEHKIDQGDEELFRRYLPEKDYKPNFRDFLKQYNRSLWETRLEMVCDDMLYSIRNSQFIKHASEKFVIVEEAHMADTSEMDAAFNHFFTKNADGFILADKAELLKYAILQGCQSLQNMWWFYQRYISAIQLQQELHAPQDEIVEDKAGMDSDKKLQAEAPVSDEDVVNMIVGCFYGNKEAARQFVETIKGMPQKQIPSYVAELIREKVISNMSYGTDLWRPLHQTGLYSATCQNWTKRVKDAL